MIELSKCPRCAPEDQVVIAGKEFCMRCGTPAEDNATMEAGGTPGSSQSPAVAKFNSTPPPAMIPFTFEPAPATALAPVAGSQPAAAAASIDSQIAALSAVPAPAPAVVPAAAPAPAPAAPAPAPAALAEAPAAAVVPAPAPAFGTDSPAMIDPVATGIPVQMATNTAVAPIAPPALPQQQPLPAPALPQNAVATESLVMQTPTNDQLKAADIYQAAATTTASAVPIAVALPANSVGNSPEGVIPESPIELDGQTGVLSDSQFEELKNSITPTESPIAQPIVATSANTLGIPPAAAVAAAPAVAPVAAVAAIDGVTLANRPTLAPPAALTATPIVAPAVAAPVIAPAPQSNDIYSNPAPANNLAVDSTAIAQVATSLSDQPIKSSSINKVLKPAGVAVSIVTLFMLGAYIWKVNYPNLAFKIASAKAGIVANLPGYMPSGFDLGGEIQTNPGSVSYTLQNEQAGKRILVSQTKTDWDSQALAENYVAPKSENYLALQAQGLTVYIFGKNQATWVNHGTWYKIESPDRSLEQEEIIRMATSL